MCVVRNGVGKKVINFCVEEKTSLTLSQLQIHTEALATPRDPKNTQRNVKCNEKQAQSHTIIKAYDTNKTYDKRQR